jgi:virginiamycin B lyase
MQQLMGPGSLPKNGLSPMLSIPHQLHLKMRRLQYLSAFLFASWAICSCGEFAVAADAAGMTRRSIGELKPSAVIRLGKSADWVAITQDSVWVGSTGPFAVHRIDPSTNKRVASVRLPGNPCAGLAIGFGSLWIPLCGGSPMLARVDLAINKLQAILKIGPAQREGGIAASADSIWMVVDKNGSLARIDPDTGSIRATIHVPPGSYNPFYSDGEVWVTRADGSEVTSVDAATGTVLATVPTGRGPRFLTAGAGAIWTLNQGDGTLTRIDAHTRQASGTIALGTPGHGGDISFGSGMVWTTVAKTPLSVIDAATATLRCQWTGTGGDSLGIGHGAIWLTDFKAGTIARIDIRDALGQCNGSF